AHAGALGGAAGRQAGGAQAARAARHRPAPVRGRDPAPADHRVPGRRRLPRRAPARGAAARGARPYRGAGHPGLDQPHDRPRPGRRAARTGGVMTDVRKLAEAHLAAWGAGDPAAVAASAASYADPDSGGVLSGAELAAHAARTLARFANQRFLADRVTGDEDAVTVSWTLRADHRDAYLGMPATNGAVTVSGTDLVTRGDD